MKPVSLLNILALTMVALVGCAKEENSPSPHRQATVALNELEAWEDKLESECHAKISQISHPSSKIHYALYLPEAWVTYGLLDSNELQKIAKCQKMLTDFASFCDANAEKFSTISDGYFLNQIQSSSHLSKMGAKFLSHRPKGNPPVEAENLLEGYNVKFVLLSNSVTSAIPDIYTSIRKGSTDQIKRAPEILLLLQKHLSGLRAALEPIKDLEGMKDYREELAQRITATDQLINFFAARSNKKLQRLVEIYQAFYNKKIYLVESWADYAIESAKKRRVTTGAYRFELSSVDDYPDVISLMEEFIEITSSEDLFPENTIFDSPFVILEKIVKYAEFARDFYKFEEIYHRYHLARDAVKKEGIYIKSIEDEGKHFHVLRFSRVLTREQQIQSVDEMKEFVKRAKALLKVKSPIKDDPIENQKEEIQHFVEFLEGYKDKDGVWKKGLIELYSK